MPSFTLLTTQPTNIKKSKLMEALHAVENLILYAFNHPNNMIMELWNDRARKGEEVCKMFRFQNKPGIRTHFDPVKDVTIAAHSFA